MKANDIIINGFNRVGTTWGVRMGDGFLDTLTEPLTPKDYIENESRTEHGKRVVVDNNIFFKSRDLTLEFCIEGSDQTDFQQKKRWFLEAMYMGEVTIQVPSQSQDIYHLIYKGKSGEYGMNPQRTFCKMSLKFEEPNPCHRD